MLFFFFLRDILFCETVLQDIEVKGFQKKELDIDMHKNILS